MKYKYSKSGVIDFRAKLEYLAVYGRASMGS